MSYILQAFINDNRFFVPLVQQAQTLLPPWLYVACGICLALGLVRLGDNVASLLGLKPTAMVTPLERAAESFGVKAAERWARAVEQAAERVGRAMEQAPEQRGCTVGQAAERDGRAMGQHHERGLEWVALGLVAVAMAIAFAGGR